MPKEKNWEIHLAANPYGKGRGLHCRTPYTPENTRLLMRALFYAANKESELTKWYASNPLVEVHAILKGCMQRE